MADYDLKSALLKIQGKPLNFGLYRGEDADQVLISSKTPGAKEVAQLEAKCGEVKRLLKGICFWEEKTLVFASKNAPALAWELMITKIFRDNKCSTFLPINLRQLGPNESDEIGGEETGGGSPPGPGQTAPGQAPPGTAQKPPPTAPPSPQKPAPTGPAPDAEARWAKLKAELVPRVKAAMADPAKKDPITKIVAAAMAKEKALAFAEAAAIFETVRPLVGAPAPPRNVPPPPPPPPPPKPGVRPPKPGKLQAAMNKITPVIKQAVLAHPEMKEEILRPVVNFQELLKKNDPESARKTLGDLAAKIKTLSGGPPGASGAGGKTLSQWQVAKDAVGEQIAKLQGVMRQSQDPLLVRIADQGLNATTGRLQIGLNVALIEFDSASGEARRKAAAKAQAIIAGFRSFLASDPVLPLLDANPLGVPVSIRSTLGSMLDSLDASLAT